MRRPVLALPAALLLWSLVAQAQQTAPAAASASNWQHVQALPAGTAIRLRASNRRLSCKLQSVDSDSITCGQGKNATFQRSDVKSIQLMHRGRSTLIGSAIGAGTGAIVGAATATSCKPNTFCLDVISRGEVAGAGAVVGGIIAAPIGFFTDFTRSTVYKAP